MDSKTEATVRTLITSGGSLWYTSTMTKGAKPGESGEVWRLVAKKGRDGRDGRDLMRGAA